MVTNQIVNIGLREGLLGATRILVTLLLPDVGGGEAGEGVSLTRRANRSSDSGQWMLEKSHLLFLTAVLLAE